jgi:hydroxymethylbilane synthase
MLARVQARLVLEWLGEGEIVVVNPPGGAQASDAKPRGGDKSRWVSDLERALLAGEVDLAVHSAKDVPGELPDGLELIGAPIRAAAEDVLVGAGSLEELPKDGHVGTSSVRRGAQLRAVRPDLHVVSLRGNVDTRLRKLADRTREARSQGSVGIPFPGVLGRPAAAGAGEDRPTHGEQATGTPPRAAREEAGKPALDAIVLARAGLIRLGRERDVACVLPPTRFVPAPGQGLLAIQARSGDMAARAAVEPILDRDASACLKAERAVARALGASCNTPLGAHAVAAGCGCLHLRAWVGLPDGSEWVTDELLGGFYDPEELGRRVAERLEAVGARGLLQRAEETAVERP